MPDIFLRSGATPSNDITLRDPTSADAGGVVAKSDADTLALADAATNILLATVDDPISLNDVATIVALLTPAEAMSATDAATLIALTGLDEPISAADTATLVSLMTPNDSGTVTDAATLIGLAAAESMAVVDAINALVVLAGPGDALTITDQAGTIAVGTPDEAISVSDAVLDILKFQSVGPFDDTFSVLDEVLSIIEIKEPPPFTPASGGAPSRDSNRRIEKPLKPLKVKRVPLDYEPAPLPQTWAFPFPPDIAGRYVRLNNRIGDLLALYMMGLIDFEELNALAAAA